MKLIKKITAFFVAFCLILLVYTSYLYTTYIDETILTGTGYGFNIGISKSDTFNNAKKIFEDKTVYIIYPEDAYGAGPFKTISFNDKDKLILDSKNTWKIYYDTNVWDSIELTFESDKLLSIYRRRQNFELP